MDGATVREEIEDAKATELKRLGSGKLLIALTGADLEPESVLGAAAADLRAAGETFRAWAETEPDGDARAAFADAADRAETHYEDVIGRLDGAEPAESAPTAAAMGEYEETIERVGALVGRSLVAGRIYTQFVSFFINEADPVLTDFFREIKAGAGEDAETGASLLADRRETDDDWERARDAAESVVETAYDGYAETLAGMGLDPKPIC